MRRSGLLTASALATLLSIPALASPCEDQIRVLEARIDDASSKAAALSGGGEAVAASRQAQAMQADAQRQASGGAVQKLPEHDVKATSAVGRRLRRYLVARAAIARPYVPWRDRHANSRRERDGALL